MNVLSRDLLGRVKDREALLSAFKEKQSGIARVTNDIKNLERLLGDKRLLRKNLEKELLESLRDIPVTDFILLEDEEAPPPALEDTLGIDVLRECDMSVLRHIEQTSGGFVAKCAKEKIEYLERRKAC